MWTPRVYCKELSKISTFPATAVKKFPYPSNKFTPRPENVSRDEHMNSVLFMVRLMESSSWLPWCLANTKAKCQHFQKTIFLELSTSKISVHNFEHVVKKNIITRSVKIHIYEMVSVSKYQNTSSIIQHNNIVRYRALRFAYLNECHTVPVSKYSWHRTT